MSYNRPASYTRNKQQQKHVTVNVKSLASAVPSAEDGFGTKRLEKGAVPALTRTPRAPDPPVLADLLEQGQGLADLHGQGRGLADLLGQGRGLADLLGQGRGR